MLCKFKKIFNFFNKKNNVFIFIVIFTWIGWGEHIVFFPCLTKLFQPTSFQMTAENSICSTVLDSGMVNDVINRNRRTFQFQLCEFFLKCENKFFGGLVKLISPHQIFAEKMGSNTTNESTENGESSSDICYFKGSKSQFYFFAFLGGFIGIIIGVVLLVIGYRIFLFTEPLIDKQVCPDIIMLSIYSGRLALPCYHSINIISGSIVCQYPRKRRKSLMKYGM